MEIGICFVSGASTCLIEREGKFNEAHEEEEDDKEEYIIPVNKLDKKKVGGVHDMANMVTVRWFDGYLEEFEATEVRFGSDLLWHERS